MYSTSDSPILHGYSIIRATLDDRRDDTVPVGVVAWQSTKPWWGCRWLASDEKVRGVDASTRKLMRITEEQLRRWADSRKVPYEPGPVEPSSDGFWRAVSEVLSTAVRLDLPRAMDPMMQPDDDIEALFEAVVQPVQPQQKRRERIDGAITRALGQLVERIPRKAQVSAFRGATEKVRRGVVTDRGILLVDGVNLAASNARRDADAFVSRFMRILAAHQGHRVSIVVGYSSSPGGLNGEAHMRDWISHRLPAKVFDLSTQATEFQDAAADACRQLDEEPEPELFDDPA